MRKLMLLLLFVLLGINGVLLWQNREEKNLKNQICSLVSDPVHQRIGEVKTSILPGVLGLVP